MSASHGAVATVTGAFGFIAGVLIAELLRKGYQVHGTVRSLKDSPKLQSFRQAFASALSTHQLQLFEADLSVSGSFAAAIKGAQLVFHTASPVILSNTTDPQRDICDPAVKGTADVVNTAFAEATVKKIVVTSSMAAVRSFIPLGQKRVFSDKDWNTTATIETSAYQVSKVQAEKKAWQLFEEHKKAGGTKVLVVVNPGWVLGPAAHASSAREAESLRFLCGFFDLSYKEHGAPLRRFNVIDVRDVAAIHIAVAEKDGCEGRYLACSAESYDPLEWGQILLAAYPQHAELFPTKLAAGVLQGTFETDNSKVVKELAIKLIPVDQIFKDTVEQLKKFGIIKA